MIQYAAAIAIGVGVWALSRGKKSPPNVAESARPQIESDMPGVDLTDESGTGEITPADDIVRGAKEQPIAPDGPVQTSFHRGAMVTSVYTSTVEDAVESAPTVMVV